MNTNETKISVFKDIYTCRDTSVTCFIRPARDDPQGSQINEKRKEV